MRKSESKLSPKNCNAVSGLTANQTAPSKRLFERKSQKTWTKSTGKQNLEEIISKIVHVTEELYVLIRKLHTLEALYGETVNLHTMKSNKISRNMCGKSVQMASKKHQNCVADQKEISNERKYLAATNSETIRSCVSVLFADIVGFTKISSNISATKVSDLLRRLYARFDALAAQHGVTNIDIIGDAYMAATNLHDDQHSDHAARLARFAIDAVRAAQDTPIDADSPDSPSVQIRVGVHCGPVSACVLGAHGGKLTLVGDTVNVASRMESCSIPGHVQCSEAAAALIARQAPDVELEPRAGGVHVKGKGQMRTCWVGSAASSSGLSGARPHRTSMCRPASMEGLGCGPRGRAPNPVSSVAHGLFVTGRSAVPSAPPEPLRSACGGLSVEPLRCGGPRRRASLTLSR